MAKSVQVLLRNLYDQNPEKRCKSAMDLGEMVAVEAVDQLAKVMLNDAEVQVRSCCAEALGTIGEVKSLTELAIAIKSEEDDKVLFSINWAIKALARKLGKTPEEVIEEYSNIRTGIIDKRAPKNVTSTTPLKKSTPETTKVAPENRLRTLVRILTRYKSLSIEKMAKLLKFDDSIILEEWLLELPDELAFKIENEEVIMPEILYTESPESKERIKELLKSFQNYFE
ncbi:MAG: HEAT repeat domain-containing protein [Candidatus Heimdallarchaeota archaeon]